MKPRTGIAIAGVVLGLGWLVFAGAIVHAQRTGEPAGPVWDEQHCEATDLAALDGGEVAAGTPVYLDVTIGAISGSDFVAHGGDTLFHLEPSLAGERRIAEGAVIRVYGTLEPARSGAGRRFRVARVDAVSNADLVSAEAEIVRLEAAGDPEPLYALGDRLLLRSQRAAAATATRLRTLAERAYRAAIEIERRRLDPNDRAAVVALADRVLELLDDRALALEILRRALVPGHDPPPEIAQRLRELHAVPYGPGGSWMLYEEVKRREGFVRRGDLWLRKEQAAFYDAVQRQRKERLRPRAGMLPEFFAAAAERGQPVLGMRKRELATAIGLPDAFDRMRVRGSVYDAWLYEQRGAYYFENDVLFAMPEGSETAGER